MVKLNLRTKSIGTRVSEQEYARLEQVAQKASKTLAEWCREVMLNSANGGAAETAVTGAGAEALMAEVVALCTILLNVLFKQSNGERLTAEEMQRLIDRGRFGQVKEGAGSALAGARVRRATERKILIFFRGFGFHSGGHSVMSQVLGRGEHQPHRTSSLFRLLFTRAFMVGLVPASLLGSGSRHYGINYAHRESARSSVRGQKVIWRYYDIHLADSHHRDRIAVQGCECLGGDVPMYLRFVTTRIDNNSHKPQGVFVASHRLLDSGDLSPEEWKSGSTYGKSSTGLMPTCQHRPKVSTRAGQYFGSNRARKRVFGTSGNWSICCNITGITWKSTNADG
jgi:hypothetical protein